MGLADTKEKVETSIDVVNKYNPHSKVYLAKQRKNNLFISSTMDYFVFFVPLTLLLVFAFNKLFHCLFNYQISIFLRPYSFWWILLETLVQGNIEYFTFLALRNFVTPFSFNIESKLLQVLVIFMFFLVILTTFASNSIYYYDYRKLAKYFLCNLFRFKSSYVLMTIMYGVRPLMKGTLHALLFEHWEIQIWCLLGVELVIQVVVLAF